MKYFCVIPVVNRFDLLHKALKSVQGQFDELVVVDNSSGLLDHKSVKYAGCKIIKTGYQGLIHALNWAHHRAIENDYDFYIFMHNDAEAIGDMPNRFLEYVARTQIRSPDWGVVFTNYDAISAFNSKMSRVVGEWADDMWPNKEQLGSYYVDIDYYRRIGLAGFETLESGLGHLVTHHSSRTIASDDKARDTIQRNHRLSREHYKRKWGGYADEEIFSIPYGTSKERETAYQYMCENELSFIVPKKSPEWRIQGSSPGNLQFTLNPQLRRKDSLRSTHSLSIGQTEIPCNESSAIIWELSDGQRSARDITETLAELYELERLDLARDIKKCIDDLKKLSILTLVPQDKGVTRNRFIDYRWKLP